MASQTKFEVGTVYSTRSLCDHDCIFKFTVVRRTAKSVWLDNVHGEIVRRTIKVWDDVEECEPFGRYSMSPSIRANRTEANV